MTCNAMRSSHVSSSHFQGTSPFEGAGFRPSEVDIKKLHFVHLHQVDLFQERGAPNRFQSCPGFMNPSLSTPPFHHTTGSPIPFCLDRDVYLENWRGFQFHTSCSANSRNEGRPTVSSHVQVS